MDYNFLKGYEGQIVVCRFGDKWKEERKNHLYNGRITNQNVREILDKELVIEFDFLQDWEIGSEQFKEARENAEKWISEIEGVLKEQNKHFKETDHKGKSPHIRFFVEGLEHYPKQYAQQYKLKLVEAILENIGFKSEMVELDRSLLTSDKKLVSLEGKPHFKPKWKGNVEEVVYEHSKGEKYQVQKERMDEIITEINQSLKTDNKEINLDPVNIKDVDVQGLSQLWKEYYTEGYRNALLMAFGGLCRRKGLSLEEGQSLLKTLLEAVGKSEYYYNTSKELSYSWNYKPEEVAVYSHLKRIGDKAEELYKKLKKCFMSKDEREYIRVKLSQLNASYVGKNVSINCQITGEQSQKAVPKGITVNCETCGKQEYFSSMDYPDLFISEIKKQTQLNEIKKKLFCDCIHAEAEEGYKPKPLKKVRIMGYMDHSVLFVRDLLIRDEKFTQGNYEPKKVYILGKELPKTKVINIKGKVFIEDKSNNISVIATEIIPLKNQIEDFFITEDMKQDFKKYFNGSVDLAEEINPDIVGEKRKIAKKCIISLLHSPSHIPDIERSKIIRGGIKVLFYGDTKVGKSEIAKDTSHKGYYELSEYAVMETGSRAGLLYTIDTDRGAIIWGVLALNDMGAVVIDGLQNIHSEEMGEFREALESGEIIVNRSIKGSAPARTRIIGCLNPFKPMNNYIYKCEALIDNYVFRNAPDVTRWDLFVPFCHNDVPSKDISQRVSKERKIPREIFINHIFWVWSRKPEQIEYTPSAIQEIKDKSKELMDTYSLESLPIVHNGVRDIISRLGVSKACELNSTDESNEKVIVEKDHITKAVEFYEEVLELMELDKYKQEREGKSEITEAEMVSVTKDLKDIHYKILAELKTGKKSSTELSDKLGKGIRTIKEYYDPLKKHELIETKTGRGVSLSLKGVKFVRWSLLGDSAIGQKNGTNKNIVQENGTIALMKVLSLSEKKEEKQEELIELPELINNKQQILEFLKKQKEEGKPIIAISELEKSCNPSLDLDKSVAELCKTGDIFKPKPIMVSLL